MTYRRKKPHGFLGKGKNEQGSLKKKELRVGSCQKEKGPPLQAKKIKKRELLEEGDDMGHSDRSGHFNQQITPR